MQVLSLLVDHQGFIRDVWGKGLRRQEAKWLCANFPLMKTEKDFWADGVRPLWLNSHSFALYTRNQR